MVRDRAQPLSPARPRVYVSRAARAKAARERREARDGEAGEVSRLDAGPGDAVQGRQIRRAGVPRAGRLADQRGLAWAGAGRHHRREPDPEPRRAPPRRSTSASTRRAAACRSSPAPAPTTPPRRSNWRGTPKRPAPTRCWWSRPITTSRRRKDSTSISRPSTTPSAFPSSSTTFPPRSVIDMSVETMKRLYELDNIVGVKDATGDVGRVSQAAPRDGRRFHSAFGRGYDGARAIWPPAATAASR